MAEPIEQSVVTGDGMTATSITPGLIFAGPAVTLAAAEASRTAAAR
jgi:hypothetical protein